MDLPEQPLVGGNSTVVVRAGDTVRRTAGPWTPSVRRLLGTLRAAGVTGVPEHLGLDERGREVLSFLVGDVAQYPLPHWLWRPEIVGEAGALLRRVHDASVPLVTEPGSWQLAIHHPVEVICHNDVAPYNLVFRDGHVVGLIDWDTASPGPRIWDLAYLAYRLVPYAEDAGADAPDAAGRAARLDLLIRAYGSDLHPTEVLRVAAERLAELAEYTDGRAVATGRSEFLQHAAMYRRDHERLRLLAGEQ